MTRCACVQIFIGAAATLRVEEAGLAREVIVSVFVPVVKIALWVQSSRWYTWNFFKFLNPSAHVQCF